MSTARQRPETGHGGAPPGEGVGRTVTPVPFVERKRGILIASILGLALAVRIAALLAFQRSLYGDFLLWDEQTYDAWARALAAGQRFNVYDQSSLPAYVMSVVYRVFGAQPVPVRVVNVIWGVTTCWLVYRIGRGLGGTGAGLLSALGAALYKPFIFFSVTLLKESLGVMLFAWVMALLVDEMNGHRPWRVLWLGIAAGLLLDVRQNAILAVGVMAILTAVQAFRRTRSPAAAALAMLALVSGALAASAPFMVRNYLDTGKVSSVPVSGFNLYLGNYLPSGTPYYRPVPFATSTAMEQGIQFTIEASRRQGRKLTPGEASRYWEGEVVATAMRQPRAFAWRVLQKALAVLHAFEEGDNHHIGFVSRFVPFFRLPFLAFWFVMPLGMAGLVVAAREDGKARALGLVLVAYAATLVAVFSNMRIRLPLLVLLIPYAAIGLVTVWRLGRARLRTSLPYGVVLAAFAVIENLPLAGAGDLTAHYNAHAINLATKGRIDESVDTWRASAAMRGAYSDFADLALAFDAAYRLHDAAAALAHVNGIADDSYAASRKYELVGDVMKEQGREAEAVVAYEKSLSLNWGQVVARLKLIELLRTRDPARAAAEEEVQRYVESFYAGISRPGAP